MTMLRDERFHDIQFVLANGEQIGANHMFLMAISPVFMEMFRDFGDDDDPEPIRLNDTNYDAFEQILKFAYFNEPNLRDDNINDVIYICHKFEIASLMPSCLQYFKFGICMS